MPSYNREITEPISLKKYLWLFLATYIGLFIVVICAMFIGVMLGVPFHINFVLKILASSASTVFVGRQFVKTMHRAPSIKERDHLAFWSVVLFALVDLSLKAVFSGVLQLVAFVLLVAHCVILYFIARWAYGSLVQKQAGKAKTEVSEIFD
ncbi:ABZJ_00895 family protein [Litorimonas sp. RW-G-Af-16]|uniref:ABZJ_00895 family protein n=1 Tax=Litorimonas sp. RW-G-Af-16 TaxID=3241168 RepID=UPI00390C917D